MKMTVTPSEFTASTAETEFTASNKRNLESSTTTPDNNFVPQPTSFYKQFCAILSLIKFEMVVFALSFAVNIQKISSFTMIIDKSCTIHLMQPLEICENLHNFSDTKSAVEKVATNYNLLRTLIHIVPGALVTIFFMPWSDKYSRKLPLQLAMAGTFIDAMAAVLCSYNFNWGLQYYFIGTVFLGFSGGNPLILAIVFSFVSDLTTVEKRTRKFAFYEISQSLAHCLSAVVGGWIYETMGYTSVFLLSITCTTFSFSVFTFFVPETRGIGNIDSRQKKAKYFFSFKVLIRGCKDIAEKSPNYSRILVVLIIISVGILHTAIMAAFDLQYIYIHHQFDWSNSHYSTFVALYKGLSFMCVFLLLPLLKRFEVSDPLIAQVGSASLAAKSFLMGFAWRESVFHVANAFGLLGFFGTCAFRSHVSKLVSKDDLGKLFSLLSISECVIPFIANLFLMEIFIVFLDTFPGAPFIFLCFLLLMPISMASWMSNNVCCGLSKCRKDDEEVPKEVPKDDSRNPRKQKHSVHFNI